jgi:hypothetical protein
MSRQLMAILVSTAMVLVSMSTTAASATFSRNPAQTDMIQSAVPPKNQAPLPPGGAAGIKQAQGSQIDPLLAIGIVAGIFLVGVLLIGDNDDDDDDGPVATTTGTH